MTDADEIIRLLGLQPHPKEGGWFLESWRSRETLSNHCLPSRYGADRQIGTAIYYLLKESSVSALHRLKSEEIFHFYLGDPVEMLQLHEDGGSSRLLLGTDLSSGQRPQVRVPAESWQGARLAKGGRFALLGCTVAPGFDYADYEHASDESGLVGKWPEHEALIRDLLRPSST